jgi:hypothetical protein
MLNFPRRGGPAHWSPLCPQGKPPLNAIENHFNQMQVFPTMRLCLLDSKAVLRYVRAAMAIDTNQALFVL